MPIILTLLHLASKISQKYDAGGHAHILTHWRNYIYSTHPLLPCGALTCCYFHWRNGGGSGIGGIICLAHLFLPRKGHQYHSFLSFTPCLSSLIKPLVQLPVCLRNFTSLSLTEKGKLIWWWGMEKTVEKCMPTGALCCKMQSALFFSSSKGFHQE